MASRIEILNEGGELFPYLVIKANHQASDTTLEDLTSSVHYHSNSFPTPMQMDQQPYLRD